MRRNERLEETKEKKRRGREREGEVEGVEGRRRRFMVIQAFI